MSGTPPSARAERLVCLLAWVTAAGYAGYGLATMLVLAPRVPYADPWRFLAQFQSHTFPANVLASDNGHREVLPNLLRLFELEYCGANQWLQIGAGFVLAVAVAAGWLRLVWTLPAPRRALAAATAAAGLFWLGNGRKLAHGNESVHLFLVQGLLLAGLAAIVRPGRGVPTSRVWLAVGCGVLATFSFGSGLACFPAFAVVLVLQGAAPRQLLPVALGAAAATAGVLAGSPRDPLEVALFERLDLLLRWLGGGAVWALSPLLDPAHAGRLPGAFLRALTEPVASTMHEAFGPHLLARWPACAFGLCGLAWLLLATHRAHRRPAAGPERLALGVAWFGASVGALVVGLRVDYFRSHPDQITTLRYVPWSLLLWTGLLLATIVQARSLRRAAWPVFAFVALLAPSTVWATRLLWQQRAAAERTALGAAVGVLARDFDLVETAERDLQQALPLLRGAGKAMFAWPETAWLGQALPAEAAAPVPLVDVVVRRVDNRLGPPGSEVTFLADTGAGDRLLLFGPDRLVRGLAIRLPFDATWHGWLRGDIAPAALAAAALR